MARTIKIFCEHGGAASTCTTCRPGYNNKVAIQKQEEYHQFIEKIGCECCGFSHRFVLELHHFATEYKRYGRAQSHKANKEDWLAGKGMYLCGNCHNILHGAYGGKIKPFPLLTKEQTKEVIKNSGGIR